MIYGQSAGLRLGVFLLHGVGGGMVGAERCQGTPAENQLQNGGLSAFLVSVFGDAVWVHAPPPPSPHIPSAEGLCAADFSFPLEKMG